MAVSRQNEKVKALTDKLEQGVREVFESERYMEYLRVMSRFHNYSHRNTLLIAMQNPNATMVAGYDAWKRQFGRHVNKNESAIKIFCFAPRKEIKERDVIDQITKMPLRNADGTVMKEEVEVTVPSFVVGNVWDVSQTSGKPLPSLFDNIEGDVHGYEDFMNAIYMVSPVPVSYEEMDDKDGYYHQVEKYIALREGMSQRQTIAAVIHELAHAKLHNLDMNNLKESLKERGKDQATMEVEAESIAYVVSQKYGIETGENSFGYIAMWSRGKELPELHASLKVISDTAKELINGIDEKLEEIRKERENEQSAEELLISGIEDRYGIYQISPDGKGKAYYFMDSDFAETQGLKIERADYELVYSDLLGAGETLDSLYEKFNMDHPADFTGHSLSVSDVVVIRRDGETKAYYVDGFGFTELPDFMLQNVKEHEADHNTVQEPEKMYYVIPDMEKPDESISFRDFETALEKYFRTPNEKEKQLGIKKGKNGLERMIYLQNRKGIDMVVFDYGKYATVYDDGIKADIQEIEEILLQRDVQIAYQVKDKFVTVQTKFDAYDYSIYDADYYLLDGGIYDNVRMGLYAAVDEIFLDEHLSFADSIVISYEDFMEKVEEAERIPAHRIEFYVAECEEFHDLRPFYGGLSLQEAVAKYKEIRNEPRLRHYGNSMGFRLIDPELKDYNNSYWPLVMDEQIVGNMLDLVKPFAEHPLVKNALSDVRTQFPDFKYLPPEHEKASLYPKKMSADELADALVQLAKEYDAYEYRNQVERPADFKTDILIALYTGEKNGFKHLLQEMIDEEGELSQKAEALLERIKAYEPETVDQEPVVKIILSQHENFTRGSYVSLKEIDEQVRKLDRMLSHDASGNVVEAEKTYRLQVAIYYTEDGQMQKVDGKMNIGDGEGGLISSMKSQISSRMKDDAWLSFMKNKGEDAYEQYIMEQENLTEHVLPYLQTYCSLEEQEPVKSPDVRKTEQPPKNVTNEKKAKPKSIRERLKENKMILAAQKSIQKERKGVERT